MSLRQTLHRQALKGLKAVALKISLLADGCDGSFVPLSKTGLQKSISEVLSLSKIAVDNNSTAQLVVDVRGRLLNLSETPTVIVKVETALNDAVIIARTNAKTRVDTWRHRSIAAAFAGIPNPAIARELIEAEVLRQVETFASDFSLAAPATDDQSTGDNNAPPDPGGDAKNCHKIRLGAIDGVPELKTVMENQCAGPPWARFCTDVPVIYTRTSKVVAYAQACAPPEVLESAKKDIEACAVMAAGAVTLAAIAAGPEAALPAFKATFIPCIEAKLGGRASQIEIALKVEQESGEWRRRT